MNEFIATAHPKPFNEDDNKEYNCYLKALSFKFSLEFVLFIIEKQLETLNNMMDADLAVEKLEDLKEMFKKIAKESVRDKE